MIARFNLQKSASIGAICCCIFFATSILFQSHAQQLAFPTAVGAGAYASGGRGGSVSVVTNLNDSGAGSLRSFANVSNTTIVFNVSGVINTNSSIDFTGDNVTIAGQTAPEGGITIDGSTTLFRGDNIIVRYLRLRGGVDENSDTLGGYYINNAVFDHCSFSFGGDEAISIIVDTPSETGGDITIQHCFIAESSTGAIFGGREAPDNATGFSFYGNVWYNISHRFPNLNSNGRYDVVNNYVHNHTKRMIRGNFAYQINEINNLYDYGPNRVWDGTLNHHGCENGNGNPLIYTNGNVLVGNESTFDDEPVTSTISEMNANNHLVWRYFYDNDACGFGEKIRGDQLEPDFFTASPFTILGEQFTVFNANELITEFVPHAGASKRLNADGSVSDGNDVLDTDWRSNIINGIYIPELNEANYVVPSINSNQRSNDYDTDLDGMPNDWEIANGLNPNVANNNGNDLDANYTNLEMFLNLVDGNSIPVIDVTGVEVTPETEEITIPETITLTATVTPNNATNQSGEWSSSDPEIATVDASGTVTPLAAGQVIITFTTNDGGFFDTSTITVFPEAFQANAGPNQSICLGESATLLASGGTNYLWSNGETTASIEVNPTQTTTYTVTVSDDLGNSDTDDVIVTVNPIPTANAGEDVTICEGETVTLTATGGDTYLWNTGETNQSINVSPNAETIYSVEVFSNACSSIDNVTVFVNEAPDITVSDDIVIIEGNSATLSVTGSDNYLWNTGETTPTITVSPTETTTYSVTSVNTNGCSTTENIIVTVEELLVVSAGEDQFVCQNDDYEIVLTATAGDSYLWNTGDTTQSIVVSPLATSTYTVTVTLGSQQDSDDVTVFVSPNPNVVITNGDNVDIMSGDFVTLSATGANTYQWNNGATQPNIAVSPSQTTTYEVRGYINDCYDEKQVTVNVIPEVIADAGEDQEICIGETVTLTANGGDEYVWSSGETTQSIVVSPTETTTYTVTVFNALDFDEDSVVVFVDTDCEDDPNSVDPGNGEPLDFDFSVYPNPSSDFVNIRLAGTTALTRIYLYDITGKLIYYEIISNENLSVTTTKQINVSDLHPGMYYVKLVDITRDISKKIMVVR